MKEFPDVEEKPDAIEKVQKNVIAMGEYGLVPKSFDDLWRIGTCIVRAGMCSPDEPIEAQVLKLQMGFELGMTITQSIQNIYVVNHRPSLWGDAIPGLVESSGKQEYFKTERLGKRNSDSSFPDDYGYKYTTKRVGKDEYSYSFTVSDAKKATLWNKTSKTGTPSTWVLYPDRMLLNRARTFCLRDVYPDVLKGLSTVEEMKDVVDAEFAVLETEVPPDAMVFDPTPSKKKEKKETPPPVIEPAIPIFDYKASGSPDANGNYHQNGHVFTAKGEYLCEEPEYKETDLGFEFNPKKDKS
jgi:hypothetical protein